MTKQMLVVRRAVVLSLVTVAVAMCLNAGAASADDRLPGGQPVGRVPRLIEIFGRLDHGLMWTFGRLDHGLTWTYGALDHGLMHIFRRRAA
jgi:hypothetical protein